MESQKNFFHLHLISDSTGETLIAAGRATAAQFQMNQALEHVYPLVRSKKQIAQVLDTISNAPGIVLYTLVDRELADTVSARCAELGLPSVSLLEPVLAVFQTYLGSPLNRQAGAQHALDAEYFARIDALNFTMEHDDGQHPENFDDADIVLVGISRTSKTPTSIYLANRGIKTANLPIILNHPMPESLINAQKALVVGLVATTDRIAQVRHNRLLGATTGFDGEEYTNRATIMEELKYAKMLCNKHNWPMIDVTRRSIEETAAAIIALRPDRRNG